MKNGTINGEPAVRAREVAAAAFLARNGERKEMRIGVVVLDEPQLVLCRICHRERLSRPHKHGARAVMAVPAEGKCSRCRRELPSLSPAKGSSQASYREFCAFSSPSTLLEVVIDITIFGVDPSDVSWEHVERPTTNGAWDEAFAAVAAIDATSASLEVG